METTTSFGCSTATMLAEAVDRNAVRFRFGWNRFERLIETSNRFGWVEESFFLAFSVRFAVRFGSGRHKLTYETRQDIDRTNKTREDKTRHDITGHIITDQSKREDLQSKALG